MEGELDLGHLTEVEQTVILNVLLRDAELRSKEEDRIRKLQQNISDPTRLRTLSGAWFNDQRSKKYQKGGADVVRASIRRKNREKDVPQMAVYNNANNSSPILEPHVDKKETKEEIRVAEAGKRKKETEKDKDVEERVASEPQHSSKPITNNTLERNGVVSIEESVVQSHNTDSRTLSSTLPSRKVDFEGPGSPELDRTRFGSVTSLSSHHMMNGSLMSLYSVGDFGDVVVSGRIQFSLQYDVKGEELQVHIVRCQDLASARKNRSDPYVKVYLLPDNTSRSKKKTSVKKKTLNPVYDEIIKYKLRRLDLQSRVLSISVWHMERMRRNLFLGEVEVGLGQWDWGHIQPTWQTLQPRIKIGPDANIINRGTIIFSIKFIPSGSDEGSYPLTGELHVWLREIVGLLPTKPGTPNTYVKSVVLPDESGLTAQKTRVVRGSVNPQFNHTMVFDGFQSSDLIQACAEITVWSPQPSTCLGGVRLSTGSGVSYGQSVCWMDSTDDEIKVWTNVIQNPNSWVETSLPVRTTLQLCSE